MEKYQKENGKVSKSERSKSEWMEESREEKRVRGVEREREGEREVESKERGSGLGNLIHVKHSFVSEGSQAKSCDHWSWFNCNYPHLKPLITVARHSV